MKGHLVLVPVNRDRRRNRQARSRQHRQAFAKREFRAAPGQMLGKVRAKQQGPEEPGMAHMLYLLRSACASAASCDLPAGGVAATPS